MKIKQITSINNQIIKEIINLKKNSDKFLLISKNIIEEAIKNDYQIDTLIVAEDKIEQLSNELMESNEKILLVNDEIINKINPTKKYNYLFALVNKKPKIKEINISNDERNIIFLENVQHPENVGSIIRTTLGLGAKKILLFNCASVYNDKVISASAGNVLNKNVVEINSSNILEQYKQNGYEIIVTDLSKDSNDIEIIKNELSKKKKVIIFGNEGTGISKEIKELSTKAIKINMKNNVDSFNVAISAAIISYLLIK